MPPRDLVCVALLGALFLLVGLPQHRNGLDPGDEGYFAYGAVRVLEGQIPNRDFVTYQPPLAYYSIAGLFRCFGISIGAMRTLGLAFFVVIPMLIYGIARQVSGRLPAFLAAVPFAVFGMTFFSFVPTFVWHGMLFALTSTFLFLRAMTSGDRRLAFAAGVVAALTGLSRHDQGAYLGVATIAAALLHWRAPGARPTEMDSASSDHALADRAKARAILLPWALGLLVILLPLVLWWLVVGAAGPMLDQLFVFTATRYRETSGIPFPRFTQWLPLPTEGRFPGFLFYVPPLFVFAATIELISQIVKNGVRLPSRRLAFLVILAALFYLQCLTRADPWHLIITLPPAFVLFGWLCERTAGSVHRAARGRAGVSAESRWPRRAFLSLSALLLAFLLVAAQRTFRIDFGRAPVPLALERARVRMRPEWAETYRVITEKVRAFAPPDRSILVMPYQPLLYLLADRRNPTRWNYLWPGDQTDDDYREMLEQLDRDPPALVVLFDREAMAAYAAPLIRYVDERYALAEDWRSVAFYIPR